MIEIDITMAIQIINILILIVIMNMILYKPVRTVLAERAKRLTALAKDVETFDKNAVLRQEEINRKVRDAREKAKKVLDEARGGAQAAGAETMAKIRDEATAAKNEQLAAIRKEFATAQQELRGQVEGFAVEMASKIVGRSL